MEKKGLGRRPGWGWEGEKAGGEGVREEERGWQVLATWQAKKKKNEGGVVW